MGISLLLEPRIKLSSDEIDLCSLISVKALAKRLLDRGQRIDVLILNAGIGGWSGLNWPLAVWSVLTDWVQGTTYPTYKLGYTGNVTKRQTVAIDGEDASKQEPALGETFTANVFGHYMLAHMLTPLMESPATSNDPHDNSAERARIIWVSSLEAYAHTFNPDDIQGLKTDASYESSKRLTDLLVLTSELPSTKSSVSSYLSPSSSSTETPITQTCLPPKMYLAHPGICGTAIASLHPILDYAMLFAFYVSRLLGSPWHTISAYLGACAPVWLALTAVRELAVYESVGRKSKWGSSADVFGKERVVRTEVEGWGWSGRVGERADGSLRNKRGRWRGLKEVDAESREEFEVLGQRVWREMEALRVDWERRLERVGHVEGDAT